MKKLLLSIISLIVLSGCQNSVEETPSLPVEMASSSSSVKFTIEDPNVVKLDQMVNAPEEENENIVFDDQKKGVLITESEVIPASIELAPESELIIYNSTGEQLNLVSSTETCSENPERIIIEASRNVLLKFNDQQKCTYEIDSERILNISVQ